MTIEDRKERDIALLYVEIDRLNVRNNALQQKISELQENLTEKNQELLLSNDLSFQKQERLHKFREALAFAASVIKCGEKWTDRCEEIIGKLLHHEK